MYGQPNGGDVRAGPIHSMPGVGRDVDVIPRLQLDGVTALKGQSRRALKEDDPLSLRLIVPEIRWGMMTLGNDAFDSERARAGEDFREQLLR